MFNLDTGEIQLTPKLSLGPSFLLSHLKELDDFSAWKEMPSRSGALLQRVMQDSKERKFLTRLTFYLDHLEGVYLAFFLPNEVEITGTNLFPTIDPTRYNYHKNILELELGTPPPYKWQSWGFLGLSLYAPMNLSVIKVDYTIK
jgi:hypothetical protein